MNGYLHLTRGQLRLFLRNRQVLIWTLAFPIFFMVLLGSFLGKGNPVSVSGTVVDHDNTNASRLLAEELKRSTVLRLTEAQVLDPELDALKKGDHQLVIVIPSGYERSLQRSSEDSGDGNVEGAGSRQAGGGKAAVSLTVYYDETNTAVSTVGLQLLAPMIDGIDKRLTGYAPLIGIDPKGIQSLKLSYIDFLVPGIVAMMIMSNNLNGVAGQIASWRERGILRQMQSTTLRASTFIAAQITARLVLNGLQAAIVVAVGALFFGVHISGSWLLLLLFIILGTLAFMAIGFIIAGLAKTPESAGPIAGVISFPMLFVGGVFFPIQDMPQWVQSIVKLLPIAHLTTALRQIMNVGAGWTELWGEALLLGGWLAAAFIIASFTFKWE